MADLPTNSATSLDYHSVSGASAGRPASWQTIVEQRDSYDERDCLDPSHSLASNKLKDRNEDDVVIFNYSLNPDYLNNADGNPFEEGGPSSGHFSADDDIFFQVSKHELIEPAQFDRIINSPPLLSPGARLAVM